MYPRAIRSAISILLAAGGLALAQTPAGSALPRLLRFSGVARDTSGNPVSGMAGLTLALYAEQTGGAPLWTETQNAQLDRAGRYSVLLGATKAAGLPAELFAAEQAHWVGVSVEGQTEQPRVMLVSTPYALKAGDAETLGGLPPSAFLLAAAPSGHTGPAAGAAVEPLASSTPATSTGTANYIPLWTDNSGGLGNSVIYQAGSNRGRIGINTTSPATPLDVKGASTFRGAVTLPATGSASASAGADSEPIALSASSFNNNSGDGVSQTFQWQAEPTANNTTNPSGTLNLLFASGSNTPAETGLSIAPNGQITFAQGQTFPGAGSISSVTAGPGLAGGGTSGAVTLNVASGGIQNSMLLNPALTIAAGTDLTGGGLVSLGGTTTLNLDTTKVPQLGASNTFTGPVTINNTTVMTGSNPSGVLQVTNTAATGTAPAIVGTTESNGANAVKGIISATTGANAGIFGSTASTAGYGVYGTSPNIGVYGIGAIGVNGVANVGGLSGSFQGGPVSIAGNGNSAVLGDPGCGSGFAGIGLTGSLSGCTNYALLGGSKGDTYINSTGAGTIHFRNNNNELATIDNSGNLKIVGQNGGGKLTVPAQTTITTANSGGALLVTNTETSGAGAALIGTSQSNAAFAVKGIVTATSGAYAGVYGQTSSPSGTGVYGVGVNVSSSKSQLASTQSGAWGDTNQTNGVGVLGTADNGNGGLFVNNSQTNPGLMAINLADNKSDAFWAGGGPPTFGLCDIDTSGDLLCFGSKSAVVQVDGGARRVALYAMEAPDNWFEDIGSGKLANGATQIQLDPTFVQTVNTGVAYHVFLTPKGDCRGLYVSNETAGSFEVHELGGGASSVAFDYRIIARRTGYETIRLGDQTERFRKIDAERARLLESARTAR